MTTTTTTSRTRQRLKIPDNGAIHQLILFDAGMDFGKEMSDAVLVHHLIIQINFGAQFVVLSSQIADVVDAFAQDGRFVGLGFFGSHQITQFRDFVVD